MMLRPTPLPAAEPSAPTVRPKVANRRASSPAAPNLPVKTTATATSSPDGLSYRFHTAGDERFTRYVMLHMASLTSAGPEAAAVSAVPGMYSNLSGGTNTIVHDYRATSEWHHF